MKIRKKIAVIAAAALCGLGATATPAQASWNDCPSHGLCLYEFANGVGDWYFAPVEGLSNNTCVPLPAHRNNWASSAWNRAHYYSVKLYTGGSCGGTMIGDMDQNEYLANFNGWQLTASSYRVLEYA